MPVEEVFSIKGRGTVATGLITRGTIQPMTEVEIVGLGPTRLVTVTGVEMFQKVQEEGQAGQSVGILLRGIDRTQIEPGMVLAAPGTIRPISRFEADIRILPPEEGGPSSPILDRYRPTIRIGTALVVGEISLPDGSEMLMPGEGALISVETIRPLAMEVGDPVTLLEETTIIGAGFVTRLLEGP